MAVYTQLSQSDITSFLAAYDVGEIKSFKGIAEGVSNTNYLLTTLSSPSPAPPFRERELSVTNYILTIFEQNFNAADLPFFMNLTEHLANKGIVCPRPIHNKNAAIIGNIKDKPAVLIEFLQGRGNPHITPRHLELVGELVAKLHLAAQDFPQNRANELSITGLHKIFSGFSENVDKIHAELKREMAAEFLFLTQNFPKNLPAGIVHTDIFPDNVFFVDGNTDQPELSGIIDFYFSCHDFWMYDLAIVQNAWCFDAAHQFVSARADALFRGYNSVRKITEEEKLAMPILARAAAMRFLVTRCHAWFNRVDGALVNIKDPMEYVQKLRFHQQGNQVVT